MMTERKGLTDAEEESRLRLAVATRHVRVIPEAQLPVALLAAVKKHARNCSLADADRSPLPELKIRTDGCSHSLEHLIKIRKLVPRLSIERQAKYADAIIVTMTLM